MRRARSGQRAAKAVRRPEKRGRCSATRPRARAVEATLAALAHDIRTPLTGILALSELLATSGLDARERGWATAIKSTAEHLTMLASLIVDAARENAKGLALARTPFRPVSLVESMRVSLAARAETKGIAAVVMIAPDMQEAAIGDVVRLRAMLENLLDNAVKFTERGSVSLEARSEPAARGRMRLIFTVTDSGIGLTPAELRRLFRPFAQANEEIARRYGGTGLGLAFVKRIAKAMGGDLTVASEAGHGSRFRLTVMVERAAKTSVPLEGAVNVRVPPVRTVDVLCVEDNPYGRVVLNTILTELGHRADFVGSGPAAIEAIIRGRYGAVLMDVTMQGMDGSEATRRIRALGPPAGKIPIIGISGHSSATDEATARAAGMDAYLTKPISPSALAHALERVTAAE